jgi:hypothetical protein
VLLVAGALGMTQVRADGAKPASAADDFAPFVQLAPFVVNGQTLAISVHARSNRDRRYAEEFAEEVVKVVHESVTVKTGKGLVIIGRKGEPHPIHVFRKFLAMAEAGQLDPAVAARAPELSAMLDFWRLAVDHEGEASVDGGDTGGDHEAKEYLDFDKIVTALPLPLEGVGAKLYRLAWSEKFDDAKVEAQLRALRADDLESPDLFAHFDWVFYLPPRGAFDRVLDDIIDAALEEEEIGFMSRMLVKGVLVAVKPKIRRAIEALRQGLMFRTVVDARTDYDKETLTALTEAYIEALMPDEKPAKGTDHERVVQAVRAEMQSMAEKSAGNVEPAPASEDARVGA